MYRMKKLDLKDRKTLIIIIIVGVLLIAGGVTAIVLSNKKVDIPQAEKGEGNKNETPSETKKIEVIDLESKSRPYAVMINNNSAVWTYQSGLNDAFIVYEMLVEGGITREMAIYKDAKTPKIQSVRSSRHYFLDYALENDAIYVHWGWSPKAQSDISSLKINNINALTMEGPYFFRDSTVNAAYEHRGYTTMEKLEAAAKKLGYRTTSEEMSLLTYDADEIDFEKFENVKDATYVEIPYSNGYTAKFYYDDVSKQYTKKQNNTNMVDYTTKEKFTTDNIIVYNVEYFTIDSYGRQDMKNLTSGTGYYISRGKAIPIKWQKKSRDGKTIYMYENGEELIINDGRTYIGLQPKGRSPKLTTK